MEVRHERIGPDDAGRRLDRFVARACAGVPRGRILRAVRKGEVRVNRRRADPAYRLREGDDVRVPPLKPPDAAARTGEAAVGDTMAREIAEAIVYEDGDLVAIDKPSGVAVHGGHGVRAGVIEALRAARPDLPEAQLVHRLDRETSGLLLVAKTPDALRTWTRALRQGEVAKRYRVLVAGQWRGDAHTVRARLRKNVLRGGERMAVVDRRGKPSVTVLRPLERGTRASLLEASLQTGRTHQIRVHCAHLGFPIAGDTKYGDADFNRWASEAWGLRRIFLHALALALPGRQGREPVTIEAPLPEELRSVLETWRHR